MFTLLLASVALGTVGFEPAVPEARFTGEETLTQDGSTELWSAIERHRDPDESLFGQETFNWASAWPLEADWAPWIAGCFGTSQPDSSLFLLHLGLGEQDASGTPILMVHGAGDNGSRAFVTLASHQDALGRPVYALTFAHPHGDLFMQAEVVSDAIARVRYRTGADQVDVVGHSKGGIAAALYASNHEQASWSSEVYGERATPYRGDIRRLVLVATPLGGLDTPFRWPVTNLASLNAESAAAPTSWSLHYPWGSAVSAVYTDLRQQDLLPDDGDLFPGQRQLLARQDHPLPGTLDWLGVYAAQPDWWTTYNGGLGFQSHSEGIDAAVAASTSASGGSLLEQLADNGVDPEVELYLLAGSNPLLASGWEAWWATWFDQVWLDLATGSGDLWAAMLARAVGDGLTPAGISEDEIQGLASGKLVLGEISGPSDGLLFTDSALRASTLTARGALVVLQHTADLSHLDLLYASPVTGQLMVEEADADPVDSGWMRSLGERYAAEDSIGWIEAVLADPGEIETDTADTGDLDTASPRDTAPPGASADTAQPDGPAPCGCRTSPLPFPVLLSLLAFQATLCRRRESHPSRRNERCI